MKKNLFHITSYYTTFLFFNNTNWYIIQIVLLSSQNSLTHFYYNKTK